MEGLSVALVSDFYYPDLGGVELQIKQLAKYLKEKVSNVIVVTHCRPHHYGQMMVQGVKTYYLPWAYASSGAVYPTFFMDYLQAKEILLREKIDIVHVHQSTSTLGCSYALYAYHLGLKAIHTEHSLFNIRTNLYLNFSWIISTYYRFYSKFICVSRAVRNNLILRSYVSSKKTIVIPNAVLAPTQVVHKRYNGQKIRIVIVGRLVYRRGVDLLIEVLPTFCDRNKLEDYSIEIIGDGPKYKVLRMFVEKNKLSNRVIFHGGLPNQKTLQIVKQCHIFLSTALTESFGIAIVQAAHLGLQCISTNVGGVSEVLPSDRLHTVQVTPNSIIMKLQKLIKEIKNRQTNPQVAMPKAVYYDKEDCFGRVMEVYQQVSKLSLQSQKIPILKDFFLKGSLVAIVIILIFSILYSLDGVSKCIKYLRSKLHLQ